MRRIQKPTTPTRLTSARSSSSSRLNATIAPRDDLSRRVLNPRRSAMPGHLSETIRTEPEQDIDENEVFYNDYLLSLAAEAVLNRKIPEKGKTIATQIVAIVKKQDACECKLSDIRMRIRDIQTLHHFEIAVNNQLNGFNNFLEVHEEKIMNTLNKIYSNLEISDKLISKNITVPETDDDLDILQKNLDKCNEALNNINNFLSGSSDGVSALNKNLVEYNDTVNTAEKQLEWSHESLEKLQFNMLKAFSSLLNKISV